MRTWWKHGLLDGEQRYRNGDTSGYQMFYITHGATFLSQLDALLKNRGSSLDALLPALIRADMPEDGNLPASFIGQIQKLGGKEADLLLTRYVGKVQTP